MTEALFDAQLDSPTKEVQQEKQEHEQCPQSCIQIQGRMNNLEKRYLAQDKKLDAILSRQTEYRQDMHVFQQQMATELGTIKDSIKTFDTFSWFIDTINDWRNNLFWGVAKFVIIAVCLFAFATNCESMKSAIKKLLIGV
jgi:uncharacterized coiled-coil protein SlyX